ncbi:heterokaryon incompatibility protein-domain-containing protein [Triangularia verruculosa]|uniref:Heterokaryon incompatibility protein-domain-containing protein n=1 Tax=Triangularia verruculosa TaxID=2587418 RepID=A0AAN7AXG4_9PEZI|nr:heterokaryon incompatibility protein-domain-containing protein [Triangularia verruculosa]
MPRSRPKRRPSETVGQTKTSKQSCPICQKIILAFTPPSKAPVENHDEPYVGSVQGVHNGVHLGDKGDKNFKKEEMPATDENGEGVSGYDSDEDSYQEVHTEVLGTWKKVMVDSKCQRHKEILLSRRNWMWARGPKPTQDLQKISISLVHWLYAGNSYRQLSVEWAEGQKPRSVTKPLLLLPSQSSDNLERYGRPIHAHWIDSSLFRQWKTDCDRFHPNCTSSSSVPSALVHIRPSWLVDIVRQCIIPAQPSYKYVCLSYVWGGQQFTTQLGNLRKLQQRNSLSSVPIAKTITDAIAIVRMAGERYLWVDALCIVQDDDKHKQQDVQSMSGIYANASFTIIVQSSTSADSGICGLYGISHRREIQQDTWYLGPSATLISGTVNESWREYHSGSWGKRGWTFQEELFSKRQLILGKLAPVEWRCMSAWWYEDIQLPSRMIRMHRQLSRVKQSIQQFHDILPNISALKAVIDKYGSRHFTLPEDSLRAFSGIATALSSFHAGFISGLPRDFFYAAILWVPGSQHTPLRWPEGMPKESCVPSWSWAAWQARPHLSAWLLADTYNYETAVALESASPVVQWSYHTTMGGPGVVIKDRYHALKEQYFDSDTVPCPPGWSRTPVLGCDSNQTLERTRRTKWLYSYSDGHKSLQGLCHPVPLKGDEDVGAPGMIIAPWVSCTTRSGVLIDAEQISPEKDGSFRFLRDSTGTWAGILELNPHPLLPAHGWPTASGGSMRGRSLTLLEVAKGESLEPLELRLACMDEADHPERPRGTPWYKYYYVMWVVWRDGIAYRRGLGRVVESIWEALEKKQVHLMLG